jgi:hypothetical protein
MVIHARISSHPRISTYISTNFPLVLEVYVSMSIPLIEVQLTNPYPCMDIYIVKKVVSIRLILD